MNKIDKIALLWCTNEGNEWMTERVTLPVGSPEEEVEDEVRSNEL